jgi:TPR repeat protein
MRISDNILPVTLFIAGLGLASAFAFDGTRTPGDIAPPVGVAGPGIPGALQGPTPQSLHVPNAPHGGPMEAFQSGTKALRAGDTKTGITALEYAAANGHTIAQWKLGRMYADGDGVNRDDLRAFEYFRGIAEAHADEAPGTAQARFVANAFVALGNYYLEGIPDTSVKADPDRAREMYNYAASYFADPDAQYRLGRMFLDGHGGGKDPKQAARWLSLAAHKGQVQAQAVLGSMLFKGEHMPRQAARGLMWLTLARDGAPRESWISDLYAAAMKQATPEERAAAYNYLEGWLKGRRE